MTISIKTALRAVAAPGILLLATACVQQPRPLYYWGGYQEQVYDYFKNAGGGFEKQIIALEADTEKARATGAQLPPGFHAHLGLLYAQVGKENQVIQQLETEKTLYPESAKYMDFLIARYSGSGEKK
ncbi:DUF4810 domain-containing protein [Pigmentiphaga litoralis]|uniref:DUF4810 domain-containing protein n=1 Tax=Pigmentiphaga litoralis TaxID=516702 RepID=A0A7Y9LP91_9BURK|nr:DUF4810 domain-containing protein [Pigmentiphaga litoralis]NYE22207.1 hypothetical protein [Pigmentiphaga litoralis]NYE84178.1 hypothetical protein [Pigmentiphaga litoralis]